MRIIHSSTHFNSFEIYDIVICNRFLRDQIITAASNKSTSKDITKDMVRVKSSNIWSYIIDVRKPTDRTGDVYVQFKGKHGGPGDIYVYYDVPLITYRRWLSAPSKGHYFWKYIRGIFKFSKLTGDKRTKQPGGVDYDARQRAKSRGGNE